MSDHGCNLVWVQSNMGAVMFGAIKLVAIQNGGNQVGATPWVQSQKGAITMEST